MNPIAHSHRTAAPHRLDDHLEATAARAAQIAAKWGAADWGRAAGAAHDIGKCSDAFQARVRGSGERVDHSTTGAQIVAETYTGGLRGNLLAYGIAGHHGGMPDGSGDGESTLERRLKKPRPLIDHSDVVVLPADLDIPRINQHPTDGAARLGFQAHHFGRMIFSALVDADFLDTESYYAAANDRDVARGSSHPLHRIARRLDRHMSDLAANAPATDLNQARAQILDACRAAITQRPGLFTLTVPTGGGKTLASLAWALGHARAWGKDRVIYVAPFTSIIDQTAAVFRGALGDYADAVLEHHSAYRESANLEAEAKLARNAENWDSPIVITTAVQFFESLFANKPSRCRKLHNIANSVVILDEAQTLPPRLLRPCVAMLDDLARNYGVTILLCTATQPALIERPGDERSFEGGLSLSQRMVK